MAKPKITQRKITDYIPDDKNANSGSERGLQMLENSLHEVGVGRSLTADKHDKIPAGNKTIEAAMNAGIEDVIEIETDGHALIVHKRSDWDLDDPQGAARKYAYLDNRVGQVSLNWDAAQIAADVEAGVDLSGMWTPPELEDLLADYRIGEVVADPGAQIDHAAELQQKWQVKPGDLWTIGKHRLLCGDSTKAEDVARVMGGEKANIIIADPPYGVDYKRGKYDGIPRKSNMPTTIEGDYRKGLEQQAFICDAFATAKLHVVDNGVIYMWSASLVEGTHSMLGLIDAGVHIQSQLIWNKSSLVLGRSDYQWKHEPCWYGYWDGKDRIWNGGRDKTTVIDETKISASFHPNEKPVGLYTYFLENSTHSGMLVYDPFGGSGTTMVACEQLSRQCRMIEIAENYCAVILERMAGMGLEPRLEGQA